MFKKTSNFLIFFLSFFLILHFLGWQKFYANCFFYDKIVHFFAGASVILAVIWLVKKHIFHVNIKNITLIALFILLCLALIWEIFEYSVDQKIGRIVLEPLQSGQMDTLGDFAANFLGGGIILLFQKRNKKQLLK